jgi:hypothetical protein
VIVACVLRSGGDYDVEYVERLRDGVAEHLDGAQFVCLSDVPVPCDRIPLITDWPGWWAKIEVFRLTGQVLYLDLDTVVVGSLAPLAEQREFTVAPNWFHPEQMNTAVMAFDGDYSYLFERFRPDLIAKYRRPERWGDQGYVQDHIEAPWQRFEDRHVASYKCGKRTEDTRVVCFHGRPRPREVGWRV